MTTPTTYAMPEEPEGPLWDKTGVKWVTTWGGWTMSPDYSTSPVTWRDLLHRHGPLATVPPWKPEVGGVCETREQYEAMPLGSVVAAGIPYALPVTVTKCDGRREWVAVASEALSDRHMAGTPCTILRVGWSA